MIVNKTCRYCGRTIAVPIPDPVPAEEGDELSQSKADAMAAMQRVLMNSHRVACDACHEYQHVQAGRFEFLQKLVLAKVEVPKKDKDLRAQFDDRIKKLVGAIITTAGKFYGQDMKGFFNPLIEQCDSQPEAVRAELLKWDTGLRQGWKERMKAK